MKKTFIALLLALLCIAGIYGIIRLNHPTDEELVTKTQEILSEENNESKLPKGITIMARSIYRDGVFLANLDVPNDFSAEVNEIFFDDYCTYGLYHDSDFTVLSKFSLGNELDKVKFSVLSDFMELKYHDEEQMVLLFQNDFVIVDWSNNSSQTIPYSDIREFNDGTINMIDYITHEEKSIKISDETQILEPEILQSNIYEYYDDYHFSDTILDMNIYDFPYTSMQWRNITPIIANESYLCFNQEKKEVYIISQDSHKLIAENVVALYEGRDSNDNPCLIWMDSTGTVYRNYYESQDSNNVEILKNALGMNLSGQLFLKDQITEIQNYYY